MIPLGSLGLGVSWGIDPTGPPVRLVEKHLKLLLALLTMRDRKNIRYTRKTVPFQLAFYGSIFVLLISAPSLRVYYCQQYWLCLSVRMSVCHAPSNCFFFVSRWNRATFLSVSSPCAPLQNGFSSIFDLGPLKPKIYSAKFLAQNRL